MKWFYDVETTGLSAITSRITCVSVLNEFGRGKSFFGLDEEKILVDLLDFLKENNITELIGRLLKLSKVRVFVEVKSKGGKK